VGDDATRIVLLGASNVQMGAGALIGEALRAIEAGLGGGPRADVLVAAGHGRSYGAWSRVLGRGLPGIVTCGLWAALESADAASPGYAVLTDIGNDLAYGTEPEQLAAWVEACLERLQRRGLRSVVSLFPSESVERLGWLRFGLLRALLFPGRRFSRGEILARGVALNDRLRRLAGRFEAACVAPAADWFGADRIHLRPAARAEAWRALVAGWGVGPGDGLPRASRPVRLGGARPELRTILGRERRVPQPCLRLAGGGAVSFY
jgi:hypothetical protein